MSIGARGHLAVSHTSQTEGVSLSAFLTRVKNVVTSTLKNPVWVRAEIRKVQTAKSGHVYLELEERDDKSLTIASTKGVIWKGLFQKLDEKFAAGTGDGLQADIKVLLLVRAEFHLQHGFDLIIEDVDPAFTIGDLVAKLNHIRATLQKEGVFVSNRALEAPAEFVRVAVISPATSAGQGDFRSEADPIEWGGLCHFDYFTATFQGTEAPASIKKALRAVYDAHKVTTYDALAIIRGGGSTADLAWLNDLSLARWVCRIPIPVLTGIGHECDSTILDEIAHRRFDTPSKVALHIVATIRENASEAIRNLNAIANAVQRLAAGKEQAIAMQRQRLVDQAVRVLRGAEDSANQRASDIRNGAVHSVRQAGAAAGREVMRVNEGIGQVLCDAEVAIESNRAMIGERARGQVVLARIETDTQFREIALSAANTVASAASALDASRSQIQTECRHRISVVHRDVQARQDALLNGASAMERQARTLVEHAVQRIVGLGPEATLRRGYAIARDAQQQPVGSKAEAVKHPVLRLQFRDGEITAHNHDYREEA